MTAVYNTERTSGERTAHGELWSSSVGSSEYSAVYGKVHICMKINRDL